jgi:hypothetical protein
MITVKSDILTLLKQRFGSQEFSNEDVVRFVNNPPFPFDLKHLTLDEKDLHSLLKKYIVRHSERPIEKAPYLKEVITTYEISDECSSIEGDYLHGKVSIPSYEIHSKIHPQKIVFKKKDLPLVEKKKKLPTKSQFSCPIGSGLPFSINDPRLESTYNLSKTKTDWNLHEKENLDYARPFDIYKFCINPL